MPIGGRLIGVQVGGSFISCEISSSINFKQEMLAAAAIDSGRWAEFLAGERSWTMSVNGGLLLEAVGADIKTLLLANYFDTLPLFVMFSTRPTAMTELIFSGSALFDSGDITAPSTGNATWNVQLQGSGPLNHTIQDYALLIDAMPPEAAYPILVDEGF